MTKQKSGLVETLDTIQSKIGVLLKGHGFRVKGRVFNRTTSDGITQVLHVWMAPSDPPATTYIPGLRENLYGKFTIRCGIYIPEVGQYVGSGKIGSIVKEHQCCIRSDLGYIGPEKTHMWWEIQPADSLVSELLSRIKLDALTFFKEFETREAILVGYGISPGTGYTPPRIVKAIILSKMNRADDARALLIEQAKETRNPGHPVYVRALAEKLGLEGL